MLTCKFPAHGVQSFPGLKQQSVWVGIVLSNLFDYR
jgi:hypothetical protein